MSVNCSFTHIELETMATSGPVVYHSFYHAFGRFQPRTPLNIYQFFKLRFKTIHENKINLSNIIKTSNFFRKYFSRGQPICCNNNRLSGSLILIGPRHIPNPLPLSLQTPCRPPTKKRLLCTIKFIAFSILEIRPQFKI